MAEPDVSLNEDQASAAEQRISVASQRQLMWWRFRKHRLAMVAGVVIIVFYLVVIFAEFVAYADPHDTEAYRKDIPPQPIHLFDGSSFSPHVHAVIGERDPVTWMKEYVSDPETKIPVRLFARGFEYKLFGLITADRHLIGVSEGTAEESIFLLGTDTVGRDLFSRLAYATRMSLSIGLVGVTLSLFLGVLLGGMSGYYGGAVDTAIQRLIEILRSVPVIPLWMGLAAALPRDWDITRTYLAITVILSLIGWTTLARVVRGRFLALREEDYVLSAELIGCSRWRVIFRHMVPSFSSHLIAAVTLALPAMILAETSLSFLGLGLQAPAISWGTLLRDAQNVSAIVATPWMLIPAILVIVAILAFNFLGDGLRDAADPYGV
jgi:peptide/nickel transport system permease protein